MEYDMQVKVRKSIDLPGFMFVRLEFTNFRTGEIEHIMENRIRPGLVATWIGSQIAFIEITK